MIDASFVEKIESMAQPKTYVVGERTYSDAKLEEVRPPLTPTIGTLAVDTLATIVDYITSNPDKIEKFIIHIDDPKKVHLISPVFGEYRQREVMLTAVPVMNQFTFGQWLGVEPFIIALQAQFRANTQSAQLLKIVGNLQDGSIRTFADDGVTQKVEAKTGIVRVEDVDLPNPVTLVPYRTFIEVDQPSSKFIFRMRQSTNGPEMVLVEADGGAWKMEAIENIKDYFVTHIPEVGFKNGSVFLLT